MATTIDATAVVAGHRLHHDGLKLADEAVRDALAAAGAEPADVDLLVNAGLFHGRVLSEPALAALIQQDVGANPEDPHGTGHGTFSFDVANGSAGVLSALELVDGFLRAGTIRRAVVVASDADPGHRIARDFPYDPVGAALVCGWDETDRGVAGFRWMTDADAPVRRDAVVRLEDGRNHLVIREDEAFVTEAARCAAKVAGELLAEHGVRPDDVAAVAAAPFEVAFIDELASHLGVPAARIVRPGPAPRFHTAGLVAAIRDVAARPTVEGGEWILLVAAGAGISAGGALIRR